MNTFGIVWSPKVSDAIVEPYNMPLVHLLVGAPMRPGTPTTGPSITLFLPKG